MNISILRFLHEHIAHASYLLTDPATGTAVVIDPYRSVEPYLEAARWMSGNIRHIFLTEQHDDFSGGQRELQNRTGATLYAGAWTRPPFDFLPVKDGDVLEFGQVRLQIRETPGHRLEGIAILAYDLLESETEPYAAFTGDTLPLGEASLPEPRLEDGLSRAEMAKMLYESIQRKLLPLPDGTRIYPAHAGLDPNEREAMAGFEGCMRSQRLHNPALQPMSEREHSLRLLAGTARGIFSPEKAAALVLRPVSLTELLRGRRSGAQVLDFRSPADFSASHLEQSLNVPLGAAFETWLPAVLNREKPLLLVAPPGQEPEAAARLETAGFKQVAGYLRGGMQALEDRTGYLRSGRSLSMPALEEALRGSQPPLLLEIGRTGGAGTALRIPLEKLHQELEELPRDREIVVCSETPFRTSAAASYLRIQGFPKVRSLAGGLALWARRPLEERRTLRQA